jgi:predicted GNAT family N-acyltransferase
MIRIEPVKTSALMDEAHRIRKEVFVIEQGCPENVEWEFEEESHHYIALYENIIAGTARWRETGKGIKLERFAVQKDFRNKRVGQALLEHLLAETSHLGRKRYLNAQVAALNFYRRNGFIPVGEHFMEAGIEHVTMEYQP